MALMPKRVRHRKSQRGRIKGEAHRGNRVVFGDFGLQATQGGWIKAQTIESGRIAAQQYVRGEGRLYIRVVGDQVAEAKLNIFEPPRFYEAFLRGRSYAEVPDITARICGICPVAYQMSSCYALENAFGVTVGEPLRSLRRINQNPFAESTPHQF